MGTQTQEPLIEDMTREEQIKQIHSILTAATQGLQEMADNPMFRAMGVPRVSTEQFASDPVSDSLAMLRQLATVMQALGNNPMLKGVARNMLG